MHHFFVVLEWVFGLSAITIAGLIVMALAMASIRALLGHSKQKQMPWVPGDVASAEARAAAEGYLHRVLVALDIFLNVVVLRGQQDETISTHSWRASVEGKLWGKGMNTWLGWIQPFHGQKAASGDLERATARVSILSKALGVSK